MKKINLIMPMAGGGTRFKKEGITLPKPLIKLQGKPFFFWAVQSIAKFISIENLVFIVLKEHIVKNNIDKEILKYYPDAKIHVIDNILNGAVLTSLEGIKQIDNNKPVLFNDCDHAFLCNSFYNYCSERNSDEIDGALLTFTSNDPKYSYIGLDEKGNITQTMEKKVISDKAICGAYYFKNKEIFRVFANNYLKNCNYDEYFMSGVYNIMAKEKKLIKYFLTDIHVSFGTPDEYKEANKYNFEYFI